jgi:glycosyltransferase involved in cell wall biosynthesis
MKDKRAIINPLIFAVKALTLASKDFDIIDCNCSPILQIFSLKVVSKIKKTPLVMTSHEVWGDYWYSYFKNSLAGFAGKAVELASLLLATKVVVLSEKYQNATLEMGLPSCKSRIIGNGVDISGIQAVPKSPKESDVIYVGRLISYKHVDILLKAIAISKRKIPDIRCVIIGDGPESKILHDNTQILGLQKNVEFLGFLPSQDIVISQIKASKIFVLPSTREGFPLVILEANACGLPVISVFHDFNGSTSFIKSGLNGYLVNLSEEEISQKINDLLLNEQTLEEVAKKSAVFASEYDWTKVIDQLENLYGELIASVRQNKHRGLTKN